MHQNHSSSWFKLFGSWSQFGRRARNGIKYSERTRNGIKRDQTCLSGELQTILKSGFDFWESSFAFGAVCGIVRQDLALSNQSVTTQLVLAQ